MLLAPKGNGFDKIWQIDKSIFIGNYIHKPINIFLGNKFKEFLIDKLFKLLMGHCHVFRLPEIAYLKPTYLCIYLFHCIRKS